MASMYTAITFGVLQVALPSRPQFQLLSNTRFKYINASICENRGLNIVSKNELASLIGL